jgi:hypothetical protein
MEMQQQRPASPDAPTPPEIAETQPPETRADRLRWGILLALLSAFAILTAWTYNLGAYAHDAAAEHVPRGLVFSNAISDGFLYPRWVQFLHLGLGSPLFTFQPPLPYYGMDLFDRLLGLANVHVRDVDTLHRVLELHRQGLDFADAMHLETSPAGSAFLSFDRSFVRRAQGKTERPVRIP